MLALVYIILGHIKRILIPRITLLIILLTFKLAHILHLFIHTIVLHFFIINYFI